MKFVKVPRREQVYLCGLRGLDLGPSAASVAWQVLAEELINAGHPERRPPRYKDLIQIIRGATIRARQETSASQRHR